MHILMYMSVSSLPYMIELNFAALSLTCDCDPVLIPHIYSIVTTSDQAASLPKIVVCLT